MKSTLTAVDVLADIEFELMQGSISRDELGRSIQMIRQHQNKLRSQAFDAPDETADPHAILGRQFQLNDMLLTLLQEMAAGLQETRQQVKWVGQKRAEVEKRHIAVAPGESVAANAPGDSLLRPTEALQATMQPDAIYQRMALTPSARPIPLLGGLLRRVRVGLHNLVLFYVNRLAKKQTAVNQEQADWILHLNALYRHQQEEIEHLSQRLAKLEQRAETADS